MPEFLPKPDTVWTVDEARQVFAAWRRTKQQPLAEFARDHGYGANRLYWWRKRLGEQLSSASEMTLVPAVITPATNTASVVVHIASGTIEIMDATTEVIVQIVRELARSIQ